MAAVTGAKLVLKAMKKADKQYRDALSAAIYQKGFAIDAMMVPLIPVEFGRLRATHYVAPPRGIREPTVQVGVGTNYALPVHEREDLRHTPPTRSKFLEVAVRHHRSGYVRWIRNRTARNYKAGVGVSAIPKMAPTRPKTVPTTRPKRRRR